MTSDDVETLYGVAMTDDEVDGLLYDEGVGLLSLASEDVAYAVPISFGYDGEDALYFFLIQFGDHSRKVEFAETTEEATFVVYTVDSSTRWRSVMARGPIDEVTDEEREHMEAAMYDNALAARLFPYGEPITGITRAVLRIDSLSGRKGMGYEE